MLVNKVKMKLNTSNKKTVLNNFIWLFFDKIYGAVLTLYLYSLVANYFGTELFGIWNYIIAFSTLIAAFSSLGLNFIIVKKIKEKPILEEIIINNTIVLRLITGFFFSLVLLSVYYFIGVNIEMNYLAVVVLIFLSQIILNANVYIYQNEANLDNKKTVLSRNISLTTCFFLRLFLIEYGYSILFFAIVNVIEYLMFITLSMVFSRNKIRLTNFKLKKRIVIPLSLEGLPLMLSSIVVILYLKIDVLIIGYILDNESMGIYSAASRITEMTYALPVIISNVFFPKILDYINDSIKRKSILIKLYFIIIIACLGLSIFIAVFSEIIVVSLYGNEYNESIDILKIYVWSIPFMGLLVSSSKYLLAIKRSDIIFKREVMGLISNVLLNLLFIPYFGMLGAAWATLISYSIASFFSNILFKELRPLMKDQILCSYYFFKKKLWKIN